MENTQTERKIITNGVPDLSLIPQDILDMIVAALVLNMEKAMDEAERI